jgi:hypothetical protein
VPAAAEVQVLSRCSVGTPLTVETAPSPPLTVSEPLSALGFLHAGGPDKERSANSSTADFISLAALEMRVREIASLGKFSDA